MKQRRFRMLRHSATMVRRTLRSYAFLSVTIILSFSLLFGYLVWTDSTLYNTYKEVFSRDRNVVTVFDRRTNDLYTLQMIMERAERYGNLSGLRFDTVYFNYVYGRSAQPPFLLDDGRKLDSFPVGAVSVPSHAWMIPRVDKVRWLDGKEHSDYHLEQGEILIDDRLYAMFGLEEKGNVFDLVLVTHGFGMQDIPGETWKRTFSGRFTVAGVIESGEQPVLEDSGDGDVVLETTRTPLIAFCASDFNRSTCPQWEWFSTLAFYSRTPELVDAMIRSMGISSNIDAVYQNQDDALRNIRTEIGLKKIITVALLIILGINLYSSFSNALNDRKFEIGVRRALGASKWSVVRQFLYESLIVMSANILVSVWLVFTAALVYKVVRESIPYYGEYITFTLTVSPYSIGMFALCSLTLTVVFSLIFAYQTTQVQIVDYLKAE